MKQKLSNFFCDFTVTDSIKKCKDKGVKYSLLNRRAFATT